MATSRNTVTVQLPRGPITATDEGGLLVVQSLRYAVGDRFSPPTEVSAWKRPIDCTQPGPVCPQVPMPFEPLGDMTKIKRTQDEDCLRVTVVAPADARDKGGRLPVMVWIHGGAYIVGTADLRLFDTRGLARRGFVMVSIQYRLGLFGYASIPNVAPANLGLMDQIAALRWVQENVAEFGGDPGNVTIFGQSAGGDAVYSLLLAEGTDGLFKQAIIISAPFGAFQKSGKKDATLQQVIAKRAAGRDLRHLSVEELLDIQREVLDLQKKRGGGLDAFITEAGAFPLPTRTAASTRLQQVATRTRVMVGWARDDALPFVWQAPPAIRISKLPLIGSPILTVIGRMVTERVFAKGAKAFHTRYLAAGGKSCTFCIEYYPIGSKFRAAHCMETPFLFGGYEEWSKTPLLQGIEPKVYEGLSRELKNLFESFVRGEPLPAENVVVKEGYIFDTVHSKPRTFFFPLTNSIIAISLVVGLLSFAASRGMFSSPGWKLESVTFSR